MTVASEIIAYDVVVARGIEGYAILSVFRAIIAYNGDVVL